MVMDSEYSKQWAVCQKMIREWLAANIKDQELAAHIWDVWFKDIAISAYDPEQRMVTMTVPNHYVYEYIEQLFVKTVVWALSQAFGNGVNLQYELGCPEPGFADVATWLQEHSAYDSLKDPFRIAIPNAKKRMQDGLRYFLGDKAQWLDGYDKVASWLTDNRGRGLLCVGSSGRGKSLLCQKILPVILGNGGRPIPSVNASELHDRLDELKRERILIIDDLGKEPRLHFGDPDRSFFELCNNAEQTGNLLIVTTNLSTTAMSPEHPSAHFYADNIERRYGTEVLDRLKVITTMARLEGPSLRE